VADENATRKRRNNEELLVDALTGLPGPKRQSLVEALIAADEDSAWLLYRSLKRELTKAEGEYPLE
jgi:hypothetical protein